MPIFGIKRTTWLWGNPVKTNENPAGAGGTEAYTMEILDLVSYNYPRDTHEGMLTNDRYVSRNVGA